MKKNIPYLFFSILIFQLYSCRNILETDNQKQTKSLLITEFNEDYIRSLPYNSLDSLLERVKNEVSPAVQNSILEGVYFHKNFSGSKEALSFLDRIETEFPNDSMAAFSQLIRGDIFIEIMKFDTAEICLRDCYNISVKANRRVRASDAQYNTGMLLAKRGDYPEGIRLLTEAYKVSKSLEPADGGRSLNITMALARAYQGIEDYRMSYYWHDIAWRCNRIKLGDEYGAPVIAAIGMARDYKNMKMLDSAKVMLDSALWSAKKFNNQAEMPSILFASAGIDVAFGRCDLAVKNYTSLRNLVRYTESPEEMSKLNSGIGDAYLCLEKLDSAAYYYEKALHTPDTVSISKIHLQLAKVYEKQKNEVLALDHERKGNALYNQIITSNKDKRMARMQAESDVKAEIEAMKRNKTLTQYAYTFTFVVLGLIALFLIKRNKKKRRILEEEKALSETRETISAEALGEAKITMEAQVIIIKEVEQLLELKNILIENLEQRVINQSTYGQQSSDTVLLRDLRILTNEDWINFRNLFDAKFPKFNTKLKKEFSSLTAAEQRLFLLIKIDLGSEDIARALGISSTSVYTSRYRLRKKMGLAEDGDLDVFIRDF